MIGKLNGQVDEIFQDHLILDVAGVGYMIYMPFSVLSGYTPGLKISLYIETHVREDHIHLYGFDSILGKTVFCTLLTVSGVGTKVGLAILSSLSADNVINAIVMRQKDPFCNVPGIGSKLAERILIELKDKFKNINVTTHHQSKFSEVISDAILALVNLGIAKNEARNLVESSDINENHTVGDVIRIALQGRKK